MNSHAISLVIRDIKRATTLRPEEVTTEMLHEWANSLWAAIDPEQQKEVPDGLQWDFERLLEQRNLLVEDLNAARRQIDSFVAQSIRHANPS